MVVFAALLMRWMVHSPRRKVARATLFVGGVVHENSVVIETPVAFWIGSTASTPASIANVISPDLGIGLLTQEAAKGLAPLLAEKITELESPVSSGTVQSDEPAGTT